MVIGALVAGGVLLGAGAAMAVSGGGYTPSNQDCPANADSNDAGQPGSWQPQNPVPNCHNFQVIVGNDSGTRYAEAGLDQLPQGYPDFPGGFLFGVGQPGSPNFPHSGCASFNTAGENGGPGVGCGTGTGIGGKLVFDLYNPSSTTFTPTIGAPPDAPFVQGALQNGLTFYMGADDNLDAGEHDGVDGKHGTRHSANGPSDGGAISAHVSPSQAGTAPSATNPVPVAGASEGFCADNICQEVTTQQQSVYQGGGGSGPSRNVYDYSGKHWDPYNCSSGDAKSEQQCDDPNTSTVETMDTYRQQEASNVYAEPGAQIYGDPDPQSSPIDPLFEAGLTPQPTLYPLPSAYVGTCGAAANGQVIQSTGC